MTDTAVWSKYCRQGINHSLLQVQIQILHPSPLSDQLEAVFRKKNQVLDISWHMLQTKKWGKETKWQAKPDSSRLEYYRIYIHKAENVRSGRTEWVKQNYT